MHWVYRKICIPSVATVPLTPFELFYGHRLDVSSSQPFSCLAYVHLQKDQRPALAPHAAQCVFIGYPLDYKGWRFWWLQSRKEIISDSVVFRESMFPFCKPGLSGVNISTNLSPPTTQRTISPLLESPVPAFTLFPALPAAPTGPPLLPPACPLSPQPALHSQPASPHPLLPPVMPSDDPSPRLVVGIPHSAADLSAFATPPTVPFAIVAPPAANVERPRTPPAVRDLMDSFEHHPSCEAPLPDKHPSCARQPSALAKANTRQVSTWTASNDVTVPIVDVIECAFIASHSMELKLLTEALMHLDAESWISAALAEIEAHVENGTWELTQLLPGKRAIGSQWVFKLKWKPDGSINKYKGRIIAQGFSQVRGIHYNEVFASMARMATMQMVIALAAVEDLELDSVDVSTAFLNGDIDAEIYMKIPEGLGVEGDPAPGEDPKRWVVHLLKGLYGIKQGPRIWSLKLHSVLTSISFEWTDCNHSVYVYCHDGVQIMVLIHVDDLLLMSNSKEVLHAIKTELASHFKLHNLGPAMSILGMKIVHDHANHSISLSQPSYIHSILEDFHMADCNPL